MHEYLFIGGLHRSGTTLICRLLSQHPQLSALENTGVIEDEGQFLQSVYPNDNAHGGPGRFGFDPAARLDETSPLVTEENGRRIVEEWSRYWNLDGRILMEKTPANLIRGRFLQALLPATHFVFVMRHPVATSLATHKWSGTGIHSLIEHWVVCHELMLEDLVHLRSCLVVHYEHLVREPLAVLRKIERLVGVAGHDYRLRLDSGSNQGYFERWNQQFLSRADRAKPVPPAESIDLHKRKFPNVNWSRWLKAQLRRRVFGRDRQFSSALFEAQDAVALFEQRVGRFGYSLVDLNRLPAIDAGNATRAGNP